MAQLRAGDAITFGALTLHVAEQGAPAARVASVPSDPAADAAKWYAQAAAELGMARPAMPVLEGGATSRAAPQ